MHRAGTDSSRHSGGAPVTPDARRVATVHFIRNAVVVVMGMGLSGAAAGR